MKTTMYQLLINNIATYIRSDENMSYPEYYPDGPKRLTAFVASDVLAIALCKSKEDIIMDIFNAIENGSI